MRKFLLALLLWAGAVGPAEAAEIVYHQDADSLRGTLSQAKFEDFEDSTLLDGLSISGRGNISGGTLYRLVRSDQPSVFSFAEPIFGFGGMIRSGSFGSLAMTITFEDGSQQILDAFSVAPTKRYLGFSSDVGIRSVSLRSATTNTVQYYMDDLTYGAAANAVPEPATWGMMVLGLGFIGGAVRRRHVARLGLA